MALSILPTKGNEDSPMVLRMAHTYDDAVKEVDAIIHTASPVIFKVDDPQSNESFTLSAKNLRVYS